MFVEVCSALGADLYDCVYPSRTARFGTALVPEVRLVIILIRARSLHSLYPGHPASEDGGYGRRLSSDR